MIQTKIIIDFFLLFRMTRKVKIVIIGNQDSGKTVFR